MEKSNAKNGSGILTVRATTGNGSFPVSGAAVYVSEYTEGGSLLYSLRTGKDGLTPPISLDTPLKSESLSPNGKIPYSEYLVTVKKEGYYTNENIGVPIFDGITSVQTADLLPITESDIYSGITPERVYFENDGYKNLRGLDPYERGTAE